MHVHCFNQYL